LKNRYKSSARFELCSLFVDESLSEKKKKVNNRIEEMAKDKNNRNNNLVQFKLEGKGKVTN